jgi:ubiquinone/menaquinone biosynthesis C-methylase UbiE
MNTNYWTQFWNKSEILNSKNSQGQIGRTINKEPIPDDLWQETLSFILRELDLEKDDLVLDLCAGNGLLSLPMSKQVTHVTAVDFSERLIHQLKSQNIPNIKTIAEDVNEVDFDADNFSKIIFYFSIQHFNFKDVVIIFEKAFKWLKPKGIFYIGDIPDIEKLFVFFNTEQRERIYFDSIKMNEPIIGTWFYKSFLEKLGRYAGFNDVQIIEQPSHFYNARYRIDMRLKKS